MQFEGSVLLSASTDAKTMGTFLRTLKHEIEELAKRIVEGMSSPSCSGTRFMNQSIVIPDPSLVAPQHEAERAALLREAEFIVKHGFQPEMISADKDLAQFKALRERQCISNSITHSPMLTFHPEVWPNARIRICQFHVMQAIHRKATDDGAKGFKTKLTKAQMDALDIAVHDFQRLRLPGEVFDFTERFHLALHKLCMYPPTETTKAPRAPPGAPPGQDTDNAGEEDCRDDDYPEYENVQEEANMTKEEKLALRKYKSLKEYFDKYWLVPFWLREFSFVPEVSTGLTSFLAFWTDLGLPEDQTRDGTNNVNNFAEVAWKVFDAVILEHRKNKRFVLSHRLRRPSG